MPTVYHEPWLGEKPYAVGADAPEPVHDLYLVLDGPGGGPVGPVGERPFSADELDDGLGFREVAGAVDCPHDHPVPAEGQGLGVELDVEVARILEATSVGSDRECLLLSVVERVGQ